MQAQGQVGQLDDRTVLAILSHLTERAASVEQSGVRSEDEARIAIARVLQEFDPQSATVDPARIVPQDADVAATAREVLELILEDKQLGQEARELVANPPEDSQLSVELLLASAVILGALITLLQTKFRFRVSRKGGQTEFDLTVAKDAADPAMIQQTVQAVTRVVTGG
jgi:hypothetical protein